MRQTIRTPRSLGLLAVALVLSGLCVVAGLWQMRVAHDDARQEALEAAQSRSVTPLTRTVEPHAAFPADGSGQRVLTSGTYDAGKQVLVVDRRLDGAAGYWVVTPFTVTATGARLPVVRGFVRSPADAKAPLATGELTLVGSLAPSESPREPLRPLGSAQLASVDVSRLVNMWDGDIYNAFVFADLGDSRCQWGWPRRGQRERIDRAGAAAGPAVRLDPAQRRVRRAVVGVRDLRASGCGGRWFATSIAGRSRRSRPP